MKVLDLADRTVVIAGKRFLKSYAETAISEMRYVAVRVCDHCSTELKVVSGFTGKKFNIFRIEARCNCGSEIDQIDFSQVHQTIRVHVRADCERNFLNGIRKGFEMENCCNGTTECTTAVASLASDTVTPYDCVCMSDEQKSRIAELGSSFKALHNTTKMQCMETGKRSASDRCISEALTCLETAWEWAEKAIKLEGKTVER